MCQTKLPVFGIARHRMEIDGEGVTTLVTSHGCPLKCYMCLNPQSLAKETKVRYYTCEELYEVLKIDHLYFLATNGGITFGGGEPLLYASFIREFRELCKEEWRINVETSLNVSKEQLNKTIGIVDSYIIDIKDMNPEIYKSYTERSNEQVIRNLSNLVEQVEEKKIIVRVPPIPGYNSNQDVDKSIKILEDMGITNIKPFTYIERKYNNKYSD